MDLTDRIAKDSLPLTVVALLGRACGMLVPLIIARWFGADRESDAFYLALALPMFADALLGTALHATLGPMYARAKVSGHHATFLGNSVIGVTASLVLVAGVLYFLLPDVLIQLSPPPMGSGELAAQLLPWLLVALPALGLNISMGTALELSGYFLVPAWLPLVKATAYLGLTAALKGDYGIHALPMGFLGGELAQTLWLVAGIRRKHIPIALRPAGLASLLSALLVFIPVALGDLAVHVNAFIDRAMAAQLSSGTLSALEYADRVRVIPEALVGAGLLRVAFSHFANHNVSGDTSAIQRSFQDVAQWLLIILIPGSAALWMLASPVVSILFGGAAFGPEAIEMTAYTLTGYIPGIPGLMVGLLAVNLLWIRQHVKAVAVVGLFSMASNFGLNILLLPELGTLGLSLSTSINQSIVALLFLYLAQRAVGGLLSLSLLKTALLITAVSMGANYLLGNLLGTIGPDYLEQIGPIVLVLIVQGAIVMAFAASGGHLKHLLGGSQKTL